MGNDLFQRLKDTPWKQLRFEGERVTWIQAPTLQELLDLKAQHPEAKLVVGNTEIGKGPAGGKGPLEEPWALELLQSPWLEATQTWFNPSLAVCPQEDDLSAHIFTFHVWGE